MDDDEDYDSTSPVLDAFIKTRGPAVVHELTNFSLSEFNLVWKDLQSSVSQEWNVGSGRKCEVSGRDMLFMTLTSMNHCGSWDVVSVVFKEKSPTFSKRVNTFLAAIHPTLRAKYIDTVLDKYSMQHLHTSGHRFNNFPSALYAVDVTFQRTNAPAGSFNEKKRFYSKKHGQYDLKVEASVLPNGLAINSNLDFHQDKLKKIGEEDDMLDDGPMQEEYPRSWALLADKGYQGLHRQLRAITPMKRPAGGLLSAADMAVNDKIASDRVIVENFFGRLKTLWSVVGDTYTWKRENYDPYFQTCVAFTNLHIRFLPLREVDGDELHRHVNGLLSSGQKKKAKRAGSVMKSREKRKRRLSSLFYTGESAQFTSEVDSADESSIFD
ncbi:hypothetical protein DYB26_008986 [Aphanomyces astaci]|uniref:DDE Tnp4 domain-containing protein n=1 Tax=Aphanomyces astaci TaxID=112090 RepID=A0A418CLJ5_APHAT|nr:hypothetical protein DYB26_008986 [Aphanomyces astaci]